MRRLPVYLVLDTSASMAGKPLDAVKQGLNALILTLRQDPYTLETAYISIITFNSTAKQTIPLTNLISFQMPSIEVEGMTALGDALSLTADCIEKEVIKTTATQRGDWRPMVFLMTDGEPTHNWSKGLERFKALNLQMVIGCAAGHSVNPQVLKQIANVVVRLDSANESTIKSFFKWVSASVSSHSHKVNLTKLSTLNINDLPSLPAEITVIS
ncbi:MAG: VWA domain-containing protein [Methylococcales bacterium]|nr:VWA domain-containing protein [Methylococcales bacterium]